MQDYKSLCAVVMICSTLVNIQIHTHRQHFDQLIRKAQPAELKTSAKSVQVIQLVMFSIICVFIFHGCTFMQEHKQLFALTVKGIMFGISNNHRTVSIFDIFATLTTHGQAQIHIFYIYLV